MLYMIIDSIIIGSSRMSSKQRDPNPNENLIRKQRCKRRRESLICRCVLSCQGIILRVRVPLFASEARRIQY